MKPKSSKRVKIVINSDVIEKLKPCKDRWSNYLNCYGTKEFTPKQFMGLKKITHNDKLWVVFRLMTVENARLTTVAIAKTVLHIYEAKYPDDSRPRQCVEATKLYLKGKISIEELRGKRDAAYAAYAAAAADAAAYAAAYAAAADAAYAAAADAAYAAADAAYAAYAAAYAAYAAAAADAAADAAAYAAAAADAAARSKHEKLIRSVVLKYFK